MSSRGASISNLGDTRDQVKTERTLIMDLMEKFNKALSSFKEKEAAIKTDKKLTQEGKVAALEAAEKEFITTWQALDLELAEKIFKAEEELA